MYLGPIYPSHPTPRPFCKVYMQSDIWALGVILYQLVHDGQMPYHDVAGGKESRLRVLASMDYPVSFQPTLDKDLLDTMRSCLNKRPMDRPTAQSLLSHPFLTGKLQSN